MSDPARRDQAKRAEKDVSVGAANKFAARPSASPAQKALGTKTIWIAAAIILLGGVAMAGFGATRISRLFSPDVIQPTPLMGAGSDVPSVFDRELVVPRPTVASILAHHNRTSRAALAGSRDAGLPSLCYVTPWNRGGYDAVRAHPANFFMVSPVWYSVKFRPVSAPQATGGAKRPAAAGAAALPPATVEAYLEGEHDTDVAWLSDITGKNIAALATWFDAATGSPARPILSGASPDEEDPHAGTAKAARFVQRPSVAASAGSARRPRVTPRVLIEPADAHSTTLFSEPALRAQLVALLTDLVLKYDFDGLTLEATYFWPVAGEYPDHPQYRGPSAAASKTATQAPASVADRADLMFSPRELTGDDMASPRHALNLFVKHLGDALRVISVDKTLTLVVRPSAPTPIDATAAVASAPAAAAASERAPPAFFAAKDAVVVGDGASFFSLMTYDYAPAAGLQDPMVVSNLAELLERQLPKPELERRLRVHGWPAAPLPWFRGALAALSEADAAGTVLRKTLPGLNFYGMRYAHQQQSQPLLGRDFVAALSADRDAATAVRAGTARVAGVRPATEGKKHQQQKQQPLTASDLEGEIVLHAPSGEHYYRRPVYTTSTAPTAKRSGKGKTEGTVYKLTGEVETLWYPSLHSVNARIGAAKAAGAGGVSVWECGQGLDYFFELL